MVHDCRQNLSSDKLAKYASKEGDTETIFPENWENRGREGFLSRVFEGIFASGEPSPIGTFVVHVEKLSIKENSRCARMTPSHEMFPASEIPVIADNLFCKFSCDEGFLSLAIVVSIENDFDGNPLFRTNRLHVNHQWTQKIVGDKNSHRLKTRRKKIVRDEKNFSCGGNPMRRCHNLAETAIRHKKSLSELLQMLQQ